jgi:hypothetical protein
LIERAIRGEGESGMKIKSQKKAGKEKKMNQNIEEKKMKNQFQKKAKEILSSSEEMITLKGIREKMNGMIFPVPELAHRWMKEMADQGIIERARIKHIFTTEWFYGNK